MAKFKSNHSKQGSSAGGGMVVKVGLFGAILGGLFFLFKSFTGGDLPNTNPVNDYSPDEFYLPQSANDDLIHHKRFSLSYSEKHEQAEWVAYILTRDELNQEWNEREDNFLPDPSVRSGSATKDDYRGSGYDRGHLVPAADMAFDNEALVETFFMSNISPQARNFNQGIWRELEELTRIWAKKYIKLYVVTGPVLTSPKGRIGDNEVSVPNAYYKVLLDLSEPELKGIGFLLPNEVSYEPLFKYAKSIDEIEDITGINFFPELMSEDLEEELESSYNIDLWHFSKSKFELRTERWNERGGE